MFYQREGHVFYAAVYNKAKASLSLKRNNLYIKKKKSSDKNKQQRCIMMHFLPVVDLHFHKHCLNGTSGFLPLKRNKTTHGM